MNEKQQRRYREQYYMGDKVRILRGNRRGDIVTVHQSANDWVTIDEITCNRDTVLSKGNIELVERAKKEKPCAIHRFECP